MPNTQSLHLCHALTGEAKHKYNVKYYAENKDYWPEWRKKMQLNAMTGAEKKNAGEEVAGISGDRKLGRTIKKASNFANSTSSNSFYTEYYGTAQQRGTPKVYAGSGAAKKAMDRKLAEVEEKKRLEQEKRIRIRNRIASVYKLEWAEAQKKAQRLPNRIIKSIKDTLSSIKMSVVNAYHLGKK